MIECNYVQQVYDDDGDESRRVAATISAASSAFARSAMKFHSIVSSFHFCLLHFISFSHATKVLFNFNSRVHLAEEKPEEKKMMGEDELKVKTNTLSRCVDCRVIQFDSLSSLNRRWSKVSLAWDAFACHRPEIDVWDTLFFFHTKVICVWHWNWVGFACSDKRLFMHIFNERLVRRWHASREGHNQQKVLIIFSFALDF